MAIQDISITGSQAKVVTSDTKIIGLAESIAARVHLPSVAIKRTGGTMMGTTIMIGIGIMIVDEVTLVETRR